MTLNDNFSTACIQRHEDFYINKTNEIFCSAIWDGKICWPPTLAGTNITQQCPNEKNYEPSKTTYRICRLDGQWEGATPNDTSKPSGYTHYETCLNDVLYQLYYALTKGGSYEKKMRIARNTRNLEYVGLSISLLSLLISLFIFLRYRTLRNNRTRIHIHLFFAMLIQVFIRLLLYIDQAIVKEYGNMATTGIDNTGILCELAYTILEYARTAMFMWMFIEGLYLHNMLTVTVFKENAYHWFYAFIGWGVPVFITSGWVSAMMVHYKSHCWTGYNLTSYYWIVEGPRLTVLVLNILFLFNIIRILVVKLKQTHTSELKQIRTAVRATLFLIPLMGITNLLVMTDSHVEDEVWKFALWSYTTHFMTSFQGFFIALLYCFLNGEVKMVVANNLMKDMPMRYRQSQVKIGLRRRSVSGITIETEA